MANGGATALVLVGVVLVAAVLFGGSIISAVSGGIGGFSDWVNGFLQAVGLGGGSGNATGTAWFAFSVHFQDGSAAQDLNMDPTFSLFPASVTYNGHIVSAIDILIRVRLSGASLGSWSTVASQHVEIYLGTNTTPSASSTASFTDSGDSWVSGVASTVANNTLSSQTLGSLFDQLSGDFVGPVLPGQPRSLWRLQLTGTLVLSLNGKQYTSTLSAGGISLTNTFGVCSISPVDSLTFPLVEA